MQMQKRECESFAERNGYVVAKVFTEYSSGLREERKALQQLYAYCSDKRHKISAVIVTDYHRLSRSYIGLAQAAAKFAMFKVELLRTGKRQLED